MPHMEGIFINGEKAKFHPEDILDTNASQYTEEIGTATKEWLSENLTSESAGVVDKTLSIEGAAADAKETGNRISELKNTLISAVVDGYMYADVKLTSDDFMQGYWDADSTFSDTIKAMYPRRIAIKNALQVKSGLKVRYDVAGFDISIKVFANPVGTEQLELQSTAWLANSGVFDVLYDGYLTINIRKNNVDAITPSEYDSDIYVPELANLVYSGATNFVDEVATYITNSDTLDDAIKSKFVLHKAHSGSGAYIDYNTRNAIIHPIRLPFSINVSVSVGHEFCYQFYNSPENSRETLQEASAWITQCTIPANQWFCIAVRNSDNSTTDETTTESLTATYGSATFFVPEIEDGRIDINGHIYDTIGDHIRALETSSAEPVNYALSTAFVKTPINVDLLGSLTYLQSFCIYDGKYYSINGSKIAEQDASFNILRDVDLNTGHGNSLQLGSNGIAYASGWDDQKIYAVDLSTLTIVNTITLPTTGYTTCAVDDVNGLVYIFQRDTYPDTEAPYNFIVYDYINDQTIRTAKTSAFAAMQSCDMCEGRIIVLNGLGSQTAPNGYRIYTTHGDVIANYFISDFASIEPEGVFIDRDTHDLYISLVNKALYKITT